MLDLESNMSRVWAILVVVLLALMTLLPLYSHGTGDVDIWQGWIQAIERDGFISGYIQIYPPITWTILQGVALAYHALHIQMFLALKLMIMLFLVLTSVIFFLWTRNLPLTILFHLSLCISSVALGYLDILFTPFLLLALWKLKEQKIFLATTFFTLSFLVKWQPLILGPFLLVYVIGGIHPAQRKEYLKVFLRDMVLPAGVIIGLMVLLFKDGLLIALQDGIHTILSGNALNYNWLVTYILQVIQPERFGTLSNGLVNYIGINEWSSADWPIVGIPRILFAFFYLSAWAAFLWREKSFENFVRFMLVGYLAYCIFNIGVHENHLFIAGLLAVVLYWVNSQELYTMLIVVLMANVNLFLFYGITGGFPYQRVIGVDLSLPLSLFNVVFALIFWWANCWPKDLRSTLSSLRDRFT
jgi:hypothetical protein